MRKEKNYEKERRRGKKEWDKALANIVKSKKKFLRVNERYVISIRFLGEARSLFGNDENEIAFNI